MIGSQWADVLGRKEMSVECLIYRGGLLSNWFVSVEMRND